MPPLSEFYRTAVIIGDFLDAHNGAVSAVSAIFIAAFTFTLWRSTAKLWRSSQDHARHMEQSARAAGSTANAAMIQARIAERAFYDLERPYLFITDLLPIPQKTTVSFTDAEGKPRFATDWTKLAVRYSFNNHGRTPAIIYEINFRVGYCVEISSPPIYGTDLRRGETIVGQGAMSLAYSDEYVLTPDDRKRLLDGVEDREFFFYGYAKYRDVFGNLYQRGHGFRYVPNINAFHAVGGIAYNYDRKMDPRDDLTPK